MENRIVKRLRKQAETVTVTDWKNGSQVSTDPVFLIDGHGSENEIDNAITEYVLKIINNPSNNKDKELKSAFSENFEWIEDEGTSLDEFLTQYEQDASKLDQNVLRDGIKGLSYSYEFNDDPTHEQHLLYQ